MADCCLIKKVATVEVYENKNEVRAYGFMAGDRNTPVMEVRFKHLWGESNLSSCKLRWIIVDDVGSLLVGEVPIQSDNTALINLPNELFTGDRRMKVQLTVASCDGERILNLQQFTDLKVINSLAPNEVVEPVYQILINAIYDESQKYLKELETSYTQKYGSLDSLYKSARASLEQYLITAENGGNAEFLQGYSPAHFQKVENTISDLIASTKYKVGDVVQVLGYYSAGDGAGHPRIKKPEGYNGSDAVIGIDGSIWGIVHSGEVNVSWFGAKGDGVTDDTIPIQKALDVTTATKIDMESKKYKITNTIVVQDGKMLVNGNFYISKDISTALDCGSDVSLENLTFTSEKDNFETNTSKKVISIGSGSVGTEIHRENVTIKNVNIENHVGTGMWIHSAKNVLVETCKINNVGYAGVLCIACEDTIVSDCYIDGIIRQNRGDIAYGITFTGDKILFKESKNCIAKSNTIKNIPTWNGLDTHGGTDIHFINNKLYDCNFPIGIVDLESQSVDRKGSRNIFVVDNLINNFNLRNNGYLGITVSGGATGDYWAENIVISNNTLICLGDQTSNVNGAIRITKAKNVSVTGNVIDRPMPYGVCIYNNVKGFNISDNTIINANSSTHISCAIATRGPANIGSIHGNRFVYTEDINTNTADRGIWVAQDSESSVNIFGNTGNYKTDVISPYINSIVKLVDGTGGTSGSNLIEITASYNQGIIANNFKRINDRLSLIVDTLELNGQLKLSNQSFALLNNDYYINKMKSEDVLDDFVDYMDALNTNPLTRPSEPQPSERLLEFTKRYGID